MKRLIPLFLVLVLCFAVSAIKINEVELNPSSGNEWIELYNDENQDLNVSGWVLYDGLSSPKEIYIFPEGTIINQGDYYIAELNNARTLNNNGDFVTLYDNNETKIDETDLLKDSNNNDKTWQLCDSEYIFVESTKEQENSCPIQDPSTNTTNSTNDPEPEPEPEDEGEEKSSEDTEQEEIEILLDQEQENKETQAIELNFNSIEIKQDTKPLNNKNYSPYYLISFCFLLVLLYLLNQRKKSRPKKNEFN